MYATSIPDEIDPKSVKALAQAGLIQKATVVAHMQRFLILVHYGNHTAIVRENRSRNIASWPNFSDAIGYVAGNFGVVHFELDLSQGAYRELENYL